MEHYTDIADIDKARAAKRRKMCVAGIRYWQVPE